MDRDVATRSNRRTAVAGRRLGRRRLARDIARLGLGGLGLSLLAGCRQRASSGEQTAQVRVDGYLTSGPADAAAERDVSALRQGMRALHWIEGQNVTYELRYADGVAERLPALAAELVRWPVAVIVAAYTQAVQAARQASSTTPIVMAVSADPVGSGFVASLARPGGNVTGLTSLVARTIAK
jgi:putative ABC transport system substrate-binding protein